ncbi:hypothetical protein DFH08DRAFT_823359 [Mycena albidolilacea]|uniref:Uncharacterized protein n=1 Tax=Mycena albidolilacea TaxID=1033008 RepID=A0AAD6Z6R1_9AGAR|nr:hypothetical protein DFH08DRAFT_823359 [Mycena albidolilacea]
MSDSSFGRYPFVRRSPRANLCLPSIDRPCSPPEASPSPGGPNWHPCHSAQMSRDRDKDILALDFLSIRSLQVSQSGDPSPTFYVARLNQWLAHPPHPVRMLLRRPSYRSYGARCNGFLDSHFRFLYFALSVRKQTPLVRSYPSVAGPSHSNQRAGDRAFPTPSSVCLRIVCEAKIVPIPFHETIHPDQNTRGNFRGEKRFSERLHTRTGLSLILKGVNHSWVDDVQESEDGSGHIILLFVSEVKVPALSTKRQWTPTRWSSTWGVSAIS